MLTPKLLIIQNDRVNKITRYEMYNVPKFIFGKFSQAIGNWRWISAYTAERMGLYHDHNHVYFSKHSPRLITSGREASKALVRGLLRFYSNSVKVEVWLGGSLTKKFTLRRK